MTVSVTEAGAIRATRRNPRPASKDSLVPFPEAARRLGRSPDTLRLWHDAGHCLAVVSPGGQWSTYESLSRAPLIAECLMRHTDRGEELAGNAVHSGSKGDSFTVRAELHDTYCYIECEDADGPWNQQPSDTGRPHGLDLVEALSGPDNWGVDGGATGRIVWVRLETAGQ